jgi:hypothetical protein
MGPAIESESSADSTSNVRTADSNCGSLSGVVDVRVPVNQAPASNCTSTSTSAVGLLGGLDVDRLREIRIE